MGNCFSFHLLFCFDFFASSIEYLRFIHQNTHMEIHHVKPTELKSKFLIETLLRGIHPRLGHKSPLQLLPQDIYRLLFELLVTVQPDPITLDDLVDIKTVYILSSDGIEDEDCWRARKLIEDDSISRSDHSFNVVFYRINPPFVSLKFLSDTNGFWGLSSFVPKHAVSFSIPDDWEDVWSSTTQSEVEFFKYPKTLHPKITQMMENDNKQGVQEVMAGVGSTWVSPTKDLLVSLRDHSVIDFEMPVDHAHVIVSTQANPFDSTVEPTVYITFQGDYTSNASIDEQAVIHFFC